MFGRWKPPKKLPPINNHVPPFRNPTAPAPAAEPVKYERIRRAKDELAAALTELGRDHGVDLKLTVVRSYHWPGDVYEISIHVWAQHAKGEWI